MCIIHSNTDFSFWVPHHAWQVRLYVVRGGVKQMHLPEQVVQVLLAAGADVAAADQHGWTSLHHAASRDCSQVGDWTQRTQFLFQWLPEPR